MGFMYTERCQIWRYKEEIVTKRKQTCRPLDGSLEAHNGKQIFTTLRWAHKDRCFFDWGFGQWRTCFSIFSQGFCGKSMHNQAFLVDIFWMALLALNDEHRMVEKQKHRKALGKAMNFWKWWNCHPIFIKPMKIKLAPYWKLRCC